MVHATAASDCCVGATYERIAKIAIIATMRTEKTKEICRMDIYGF